MNASSWRQRLQLVTSAAALLLIMCDVLWCAVLMLHAVPACPCLFTYRIIDAHRLWGKIFERASAAKADFDAASITAFLWAATTAGGCLVSCLCVCVCLCGGRGISLQ